MPKPLQCPQQQPHTSHTWESVREIGALSCRGISARHVQPDRGAPRPGLGAEHERPAAEIGARLRELGIGLRSARFVPDRGPAVRLDVQDVSLWLDPADVDALTIALAIARRKAISA